MNVCDNLRGGGTLGIRPPPRQKCQPCHRGDVSSVWGSYVGVVSSIVVYTACYSP